MDSIEHESNHVDSDVLLPPRKRLLAGLKRQSSESPSKSSLKYAVSPALTEYESRLQNLLKSYKNGPRMSPEEIAEAAGSAAVNAAKAAEAARAAAEEKAAIAAKAVAAAKEAMSLVASFSGKLKSKAKKRVPVGNMYSKMENAGSFGMDEELARKLHRAINSSSRISKQSNGLREDTDSEGSNVAYSESEKRGRVKQKKKWLSVCSFKDRGNPKEGVVNENGSDESNVRAPIEPLAMARKCQGFKVDRCVESNKVVEHLL